MRVSSVIGRPPMKGHDESTFATWINKWRIERRRGRCGVASLAEKQALLEVIESLDIDEGHNSLLIALGGGPLIFFTGASTGPEMIKQGAPHHIDLSRDCSPRHISL